jgi:OPT oligopeptide transporter protein
VYVTHSPERTQDLTIDGFNDPNLDVMHVMALVTDDDSPYPEVRSAVANTDDPTMPASTFRAWVVGLMWAILIPGVNQLFSFRYPTVTIGSVCPSAVVSVFFLFSESNPA